MTHYSDRSSDKQHATQLPAQLHPLQELLAEDIHDTWAAGRLAEGWVYGPERNDEKKTTPCLVPYGQLTEVEKDYDRVTAIETLKMILALGYQITRPTETTE